MSPAFGIPLVLAFGAMALSSIYLMGAYWARHPEYDGRE